MFTIRYEVQGTGWAYLTVTLDGVERRMELSYIGRDINDLVWETTDLLQGKPAFELQFDTEPGEHTWKVRRIGDDVELTIESSVERMTDAEADTWETDEWTLEATMPLRVFGGAVLAAFEEVLSTEGPDGYEKKWRHAAFAVKRLDELRALIASQP